MQICMLTISLYVHVYVSLREMICINIIVLVDTCSQVYIRFNMHVWFELNVCVCL